MLGFRGHSPPNPAGTQPPSARSAANDPTTGAGKPPSHAREIDQNDAETTLVVRWQFAGLGYLSDGDAALTLSAAARARERRQALGDVI